MARRRALIAKLTRRAEELATEHKGELGQAIDKAEQAADRRTGGKYHDKIDKAARAAERYVENLPDSDTPGESTPPAPEKEPPGP